MSFESSVAKIIVEAKNSFPKTAAAKTDDDAERVRSLFFVAASLTLRTKRGIEEFLPLHV
jgi:hypothetical protein